jgi:arylsulfatase A-like enzyme
MGKWHLSDNPLPYGFDLNVGGSHSGMPPRGYYPPHPRAPGLERRPKDEYLTDHLNDRACEFIEANHEQPWMLFLTHFAVHTPINPKRELVDKYKNKPAGKLHKNVAMATMIQSVDDGVGKILETLDRLKLTDNTVIIFYSDNGGHGPVTDMAPLRGHKGTYYEGGIRVPFVIHWPAKIKPGKTEEPITGVDIFPTLAALAGAKMPDQSCDGKSLLGLATGKSNSIAETVEDRALFWHFPAYLESSRDPVLQAEQRDPIFRTRPCSVIRKGKWKLLQFFEKNEFELYNLEADIGETTNLAKKEIEVLERLKRELKQWRDRLGADIPIEKNSKFDPEMESKLLEKLNK